MPFSALESGVEVSIWCCCSGGGVAGVDVGGATWGAVQSDSSLVAAEAE